MIACCVLDGIADVGTVWIGVGNRDCLIVLDGIGECELNIGAGDGNSSDGIGTAVCCDGEGGCGGCYRGEGFVLGENNFGAVGGCGTGGEGWSDGVNCEVEGC